jgi:hypothetical protein
MEQKFVGTKERNYLTEYCIFISLKQIGYIASNLVIVAVAKTEIL